MSDVDRHEKLAACGASNCRRTQARKYTRKHQPRLCEFISFVTGEASDKCHKEKRKTVNADDILWASGNLGFYNDAESLKGYLVKYRELEGERADQNKPASSANENQTDERQQGASPPPFSFNLMGKRRT